MGKNATKGSKYAGKLLYNEWLRSVAIASTSMRAAKFRQTFLRVLE
jgi:hypothetical protein